MLKHPSCLFGFFLCASPSLRDLSVIFYSQPARNKSYSAELNPYHNFSKKKIITVIIIFSSAATYSQINDFVSNPVLQKIFSDTIKSITIENDTSKKNIQEFPPLKLKYELNTMLQSNGKFFPYYKFDFTSPENFSEDEKASGLDREQLLAYKKNKNVFREILAKEYNERWWDRVKGIDELLGVPKEVAMIIKLITVFYLYGLSY